MQKGKRKIIISLLCVAIFVLMGTVAVALATNLDKEAPQLPVKASEVKSQAEIKAVEDKIENIGKVEYDNTSLKKITEAENAYNSLTEEQKEKVSNYGTLLSVRNTYNVLAKANEETSSLVVTDSGTVNSTVKWYYYSNGLLEIAGEGVVPAYSTSNKAPWSNYADSIKRILVRNSITSIGQYAFYGCNAVEEITLPFVGESRTATELKGTFGYIFGYYTDGYTRETSTGTFSSTLYKKDSNETSGYTKITATHTVGYTSTVNNTVFIPGSVDSYTAKGKESWYSCADYCYGLSYYGNIQTYVFNIPTVLTTVNITDATQISDAAFNHLPNTIESLDDRYP